MKCLFIEKIGPLDKAEILLGRINLIIGPQRTGKSCILKVASFCAWVEKSIELNQDEKRFLTREAIDNNLIAFHNLQGYTSDESIFAYETDTMKFSFSFKNNKYTFEWKERQWDYKRHKIAYIVAERNILSVVPNWYDIDFPNNNIRCFMIEWQNARNYTGKVERLPILNTRVGYEYDNNKGTVFLLILSQMVYLKLI